MLLGKPWLRDAKLKHDWGNNVIVVQGNGIIKTISYKATLLNAHFTKHLCFVDFCFGFHFFWHYLPR
jgi:hypothetical protein